MVTVYLTYNISDSAMLSKLSELVAARIVIPLRMLITSSVFRDFLKNAFKFECLTFSMLFNREEFYLQVINIQMSNTLALIESSLSLDKAIIIPKPQMTEYYQRTYFVPVKYQFLDGSNLNSGRVIMLMGKESTTKIRANSMYLALIYFFTSPVMPGLFSRCDTNIIKKTAPTRLSTVTPTKT